jgi:predicted component of type VI protein secretion system
VELELSIEEKDTGKVTVSRLPVEGRVAIGRGPESPILIDGPLISREHFAFEVVNSQLSVIDLSSNGVWLNGYRLPTGQFYLVNEADLLSVPGYDIRCVILSGKPAGPEADKAAAAAAPKAVKKVNPLRAIVDSLSGMEIFVMLIFLAAVGMLVVFVRF